jgi:hypothetical protein
MRNRALYLYECANDIQATNVLHGCATKHLSFVARNSTEGESFLDFEPTEKGAPLFHTKFRCWYMSPEIGMGSATN